MTFDVIIVGAGPAGLAAACRLRQLCLEQSLDLSVCVIEKGSEIGAHIVSGAIIEPSALNELFPDWRERGAPLSTPVTEEDVYLLYSERGSLKIPELLLPPAMQNRTNYVASLGNLCRWLGDQAELLGIEILTGFAGSEILFDADERVIGVATGDMGRDKTGKEKPEFEPGYELLARYTVFAEGCRGHLGKQLIEKFCLDNHCDPQHYGIGIKELWEIPAANHQPGKIMHGLGWPLGFGKVTGGSFLYHMDNNQVALGLICDLNYSNPWLSPFEEFQRLKHHPRIALTLSGGKRIAFGARALTKGGIQSLPQLAVPGALLIGDNAGFLNFIKLKGSHTAMKSGMLAAESIVKSIYQDKTQFSTVSTNYDQAFKNSWLFHELQSSRNCAPAMHRFGTLGGAIFNWIDQVIFRGRLPMTLHDRQPDYATLKAAADCGRIVYPKPDNVLSFDNPSSVYLSNTAHEGDQPCHLILEDKAIPLTHNLSLYAEPAQRYCPAGVYEIVMDTDNTPRFLINAQNCLHCKTCDIKDPARNITWVAPEGGGGPNYPNM